MINHNTVVVKNDVISESQQNFLQNYVDNPSFSWSYCNGTILKNDLNFSNNFVIQKGFNPPQFVHKVNIEYDSNLVFFNCVFNFIASYYKTNIHILKCKFNLLTQRDNNQYHFPHVDIDNVEEEIKTAIYYVNNSDGDTYLFNEFAPKQNDNVTIYKKITPKKGSIVMFDSIRFHASSSPIASEKRIVLNIVFRIPKG